MRTRVRTIREVCDAIDENIDAVRNDLRGCGVNSGDINGDARSILTYLIDAGFDASWAFCDVVDSIVENMGEAYEDDERIGNDVWYVMCKLHVMYCEMHGV